MNQFFKQHGSAMTEMIVLSMVMIPLFAGISKIGSQQAETNSHDQLARYAAWERTVSNNYDLSSGLGKTMNRRFLSDDNGLIYSGLNSSSDSGEKYSARLVCAGEQDVPSLSSAKITDKVATGLKKFGEFADDAFSVFNGSANIDWVTKGSGVYLNQVAIAEEQAQVGCGEFYGNAIMVDGWVVKDSRQAEARAATFVPAIVFAPAADLVANTVGRVPIFKEISKMDGVFGNVEGEVIPTDRKPQ